MAAFETDYDKYLKLTTDEEKNAFDAAYLNNFKEFFNDFYNKIDETSKSEFIRDLKAVSKNSDALDINSLNTSIKNADEITQLQALISGNDEYLTLTENDKGETTFDESIFTEEFLKKLNYMSGYFNDKERFLKRVSLNQIIQHMIDELNTINPIKISPPTPMEIIPISFVTEDFLKALSNLTGVDEPSEAQKEFLESIKDFEFEQPSAISINFITEDFLEALNNLTKTYNISDAQKKFLTNIKDVELKIEEPKSIDLGIEIDDEGHTNIKKPKDYKFQNEILKRLLSIMPDFSNNLFTFGFFNTDDKELSLSDFALSYFKTINDLELNNPQAFNHINNNIDGFYTRVQGFDIPLPKAHTIQYKFFTRTITKVTSGIEQAHTINVKFIADQNGFIINHFQRMNNQHNPIPEKSIARELSLKELQGIFTSGSYTNRDKTLNIFIKYNDIRNSDQTSHRLYTEDRINYKMFDISNNELKEFHNKLGFNGYFLEDVQFLGFENPIEFQRDTADPIEMEAKFRFKRLYKVQ